MKHKTLIFLAALITGDLPAQITSLGTLTTDPLWPNRLVRSLAGAGAKFVFMHADGCALYNLDLTPYAAITYPAPPAGFSWSTWNPMYFSEDLFDTDPTTIEYILPATSTDGLTTATAVLRADGTLFFWVEGESLIGSYGAGDPQTASPWVFNTPQGAIMQLWNSEDEFHYYQLPGMLPCVECDGSLSPSMMMLGGGADESAMPAGMNVFPNPASRSCEVVFGALPGRAAKTLVLLDMAGKAVRRLPIPTGAERMTVTTNDVSSGTYAFRIETDTGSVPGSRLLVVR